MVEARPGKRTHDWPALPLEAWEPTKETLHRYCQLLGKVRMALDVPRNHWWHVPLYVATRGLSTGPMPAGDGYAEIALDFLDHDAVVSDSRGRRLTLPLRDGLSVAEFSTGILDALLDCDIVPDINLAAFDLGDSPALTEDTEHRSYDAEAAQRFWAVLRRVETTYRDFCSRFTGKTSPIHLFWHSFDLAVTRFSGRRAPLPAGADSVTAQAYSHEVTSFGFWPGDAEVREPAFYAYAWPEPEGLAESPLRPGAATWRQRQRGTLALLSYEEVRRAADPPAALLSFCESAYQAAARLAGWDIEALTATPADWTD